MVVIVEIPAQQDIEAAYLWISEHDDEPPDRWFNSLYETIGSLELFPEAAHSRQRADSSIRKSVRPFTDGGRLGSGFSSRSLKEVHILHVRHGARLTLGESAEE